jgi:hypothetical protein
MLKHFKVETRHRRRGEGKAEREGEGGGEREGGRERETEMSLVQRNLANPASTK